MWLWLAVGLQGQTYSVSGTAYSSYTAPGYVVDAERAQDEADGVPFNSFFYTRWYIPVSATGAVTAADSTSRRLRMAFRLVDTATGDFVPLENVNTGQEVEALYSTPVDIIGSGSSVFTQNLVVHPSVQLDPDRTYRVQAQLEQRWFFLSLELWDPQGTAQNSVARGFIHFKGPQGPDSAVNVVVKTGTVVHTRRYALANVAGKDHFAATVNYNLHRYDEPHVGSGSSNNIAVRVTLELLDLSDPATPVPLETAVFTENVSVPKLTPGFLTDAPASVNRALVVAYKPTVQLDSVAGLYSVRATIEHLEQSPSTWVEREPRSSSYWRLIHLNGTMWFGGIETELTDVASVTAPGSSSGGLNNTSATGLSGILVGGGHTFGPSGVNIAVNAAGDAFIRSPSSVSLGAPASPDQGSASDLYFDRGTITLSTSGASVDNLSLILPAGLGVGDYFDSKRLEGRVAFSGPIALNQQLLPTMNLSINYAFPRWLTEESKPVSMNVNGLQWDIANGHLRWIPSATGQAVYVRQREMDAVDAAPVAAAAKIRRSNDLYYRSVTQALSDTEVVPGFNAGAEMKVDIQLDGIRKVIGHFPYDVTYEMHSGQLVIADDRIDTASSYIRLNTPTVTLPWTAGCSEPDCDPGAGADPLLAMEVPLSGGQYRMAVAEDGGLIADVVFSGGLNLRWGYIPAKLDYAHQVVETLFEGRLAISGHFVHGSDHLGSTTGQLLGPASILLAGIDNTGSVTERPQLNFDTTTPYSLGLADYAGANIRMGGNDADPSGFHGRSRLGGEVYGPYDLKNRSKYYLRKSGVSGIHDKVPTAPESVLMYGYDITLTNFGLAFRSNENTDSRTNGEMYLPYPSNINIAFEELMFKCNGGLDTLKVGAGSGEQLLAYWLAPIDITTMRFVTADACNTDEGFLTLGVQAYSSHVEDPLPGVIGVFNHGNLIPLAFSETKGGDLTGLDSRFKMPTQTRFRGPKRQTTQGGDEVYYFSPVSDAYLNNPGLPGNNWQVSEVDHPIGGGFMNMGGFLKVAFFEAMRVHLQTSSNRPPGAGDPPGNWGTSGIEVVNGTWQIGGSSSSFFDAEFHDKWNRGYPYPSGGGAGGSGDSLETYRTSTAFYPFVRQSWLGGAIVLKYKVKWNTTTRSFRSLDASDSVDSSDGYSAEETKKFVILEIDHRLKYLSAERAELTFGASYDGLPTINLTNFVVNQIDETTGVFKAATDAGLNLVFDTVNGAIDELAATLNDNMRSYLAMVIEDPVDLFVDDVYTYLHDQWTAAASSWRDSGIPPSIAALMQTTLQNQVINQLNPSVGYAQDQITVLVDILTEVEDGLIIIRDDFLATDPGTQQLMAIRTLTRELIKVLSAEMGDTLGSLLTPLGVDQRLNDLIDPHLENIKPTVAQIYSIVSDLAEVVTQIRGTLDGVVNFDFEQQLQALFDDAMAGVNSEINQVKSGIEATVLASLGDYGPAAQNGLNFLARDPEEVKALIKNAIYDFVLDTVLIEQIQIAIKQRLQDVEKSIRQGLDNAFGEVNALVKEAVSDYLLEIDDKINGALGSVSDKLGSGSLTGYAIFNGDAMRKVRIDGKFEFKIPDETTVKAFLEINQYTSIDQPPGCIVLMENEAYTEVEIGALDVGVNFIAPDLRVNIGVKFAMKSTSSSAWSLRPDGLGGSFAISEGEVNFEAFTLTDLALGMMMSSTEGYVSAALGMRFGSYGAKGGVFFGRTCTLDPILLWDPLVADAIGEPTPSFTGAYVYGEAHIPVSEVILGIPATCFFKITADVGAGFFFFVEGPTFGARLALGVNGEILCLLSVGGRVDMVGARVGSVTRVKGKGTVRGEIGPCSFCLKVKKSVEMTAEIGADGNMAGKGGAK